MEVRVTDHIDDRRVVTGCVGVYASAFGEAPYYEPRAQAERLVDRLERYAPRAGFGLAVAEEDGEVAGFGLVVSARPGDWWRDQVARALSPEQVDHWLAQACTEIVHLAVAKPHRRRGLGSRLLHAMIDRASDPTAVLSCHPEATAARRLYLGAGWHVLSRDFRTAPDQLGFWLLALDTR